MIIIAIAGLARVSIARLKTRKHALNTTEVAKDPREKANYPIACLLVLRASAQFDAFPRNVIFRSTTFTEWPGEVLFLLSEARI